MADWDNERDTDTTGDFLFNCNVYGVKGLCMDIGGYLKQKAEVKKLTGQIDIDEYLPYWLFGDSEKIKQMLIKLIDNAVDATETGTVGLSMRHMNGGDNSVFIRFDIADSGSGELSEDVRNILSGRYNADDRMSEEPVPGIFMVKELAAHMGGKLTVKCIRNVGSTFSLLLEQKATGTETLRDYGWEGFDSEADGRNRENTGLRYATSEQPDTGMEALEKLGLDTKLALANFNGDEQKYWKILMSLCKNANTRGKLIMYYLEQRDYENFDVAIKSVLSWARTVGAVWLADKAKALEAAVGNETREYIFNESRIMVDYMEKLIISVSEIAIPHYEGVVKGGISTEDLNCMLDRLIASLEEYQLDCVEDMLYTLGQLHYKDETVVDELHCVEEYMMNYKYNKAVTLLKKIKNTISDRKNLARKEGK